MSAIAKLHTVVVLIPKPRKKDGMYSWSVSFEFENRCTEFDYFTGCGLTEIVRGAPKPPPRKLAIYEDWARNYLKPIKPTREQILQALFLDASAAHTSFTDWCSDYGYDDDSLKAFDLYRACCETHKKLKTLLGAAYREIESYIQDLEL